MNYALRILRVWLASLALATSLCAAEKLPSPIGKTIANFKLQDHLGAWHALDDWQDKQAIVVVFFGTECPLAKLYGPRLAELANRYEQKGAVFVGVDANQQDSLAEIAHYARLHRIEFPLLKDPGNRVADQFGAVRTPEAFLLDRQRVVRYRGRIDDQYGVGYSRREPQQSDLERALDEVLSRRPVSTPTTSAAGCFIGRVNRKPPRGNITYFEHIADILQRRCLECHRAGQVAPIELMSYDEAVAWSETIREVLEDGRMPPWHANPKFGKFSNDRRLPEDEKRQVLAWIDNGMPAGKPEAAPAETPFVDGWRIAKPDLEIAMPKPFTVPAKGTLEFQYFVVDPGFTEDVWVQQVEARPGNRAVIHHLVLYYVPPGRNPRQGESALFNTLTIYAPGLPASVFPPGVAKRIPAGSRIGFEVHYTPNGSEQVDLSSAGFVFADVKQVKKELSTAMAVNTAFNIPPGAEDYRVEAEYRFDQDMRLYSMLPHMHLRGKTFRYEAIYPDGRRETLLDVPHYDFNWQYSYALAEPKRMPEGTVVHCTATFDNSSGNLANPDPAASVGWGDETSEEMMVGRMEVMRDDQDLTLGAPKLRKLPAGDYEATFVYRPEAAADKVELAGSFNDWRPEATPMLGPDSSGRFTVRLKLQPGRYEYRYLIDGRRWRSDPGNPVQAGFYNHSVLEVGK